MSANHADFVFETWEDAMVVVGGMLELAENFDLERREWLRRFITNEPALNALDRLIRESVEEFKDALCKYTDDPEFVGVASIAFRSVIVSFVLQLYQLHLKTLGNVVRELDEREAVPTRSIRYAVSQPRRAIIIVHRRGELEFARMAVRQLQDGEGLDVSHVGFCLDRAPPFGTIIQYNL